MAGTPYDFTAPRPVRNSDGVTYDTNYVIGAEIEPTSGLAHAATVRSLRNGLTLEMYTDQPGVQFYDASKLNCPVPGLGGKQYGPHGGARARSAALPRWRPHHRHFPSAVLRPGQRYRQRTEYRFA